MPTARAALLEQLRYIAQARRWKVVVAYDEHTPGSELRIMEGDVDEVFTGELESADSYIERRATELCSFRTPPAVKVATDDRTIQVVSLASGAQMMSTSSLIRVRATAWVVGSVGGLKGGGDLARLSNELSTPY